MPINVRPVSTNDRFLAESEAITAEVAVWQRGGGFTAGPDECDAYAEGNKS